MKRIIKLTERDLTRIVRRVISESSNSTVSQMNSNISKVDPTGCKGMLLQNYNALKTSIGRPMDGGCIGDALYTQWPKGSANGFKGWQVQYKMEDQNTGDCEVIIFMDYKAKPKWCPRWILRFLHLFGSDNSIVRVRNRTLHNLEKRLTKGIQLTDYKTKWEWYDLRISVYGTDQMQNLADAIEHKFYNNGLREDLADQIKVLDPKTKYDKGYSIDSLRNELERLENIQPYVHGNERQPWHTVRSARLIAPNR